ncbi:hypothetical protein CARUB_v10027273mg [Capsella rubella]|uniref:DUF538 domain-containing protein n=1 Tax=Capsella rubella TaxID=81985 RepID=R0GSH5_9BRAS|nr:uncharacterized protein LOC17875090 [Capsella rubella]EOA14128.1 hypothetical protein CARUB_v10027273mg [Capsella rubella]
MNKLISRVIFLLTTLLLSSSLTSPMYYPSVHDVLRAKGLPAGLLPQEVESYILHNDGRLEVFLARPCYAKFETNVHFAAVVRANLSYGSLSGVEGLSQKELFLWLQVKDIVVENPNSGVIVFDIGVAFKQLALALFEDPPKCNPYGVLKRKTRRDRGFKAQM